MESLNRTKTVSNRKLPKFRNIFLQPSCKPLYSQVFTNSTSLTKLKTNGNFIAIPDQNGTCVGILPMPKSLLHKDVVKMTNHAPLSLQHGKPLQEFEFSTKTNLIATSTKADNILRLWKIDPFEVDLVQTLPEKEIDTPFYLLAGHEKRIDNIKFHTCLDIVASSSQDRTVKIWSLPTSEEKISLFLPNDTTALSFCFNQQHEYLLTGGSDGAISLFDPRASIEAITSIQGKHSSTKGLKISMLQTSPYFVSTGFGLEDPNRNMVLMDLRNLAKEMQEIVIKESSPNLLTPIADSNLSLLYLSGRGEGIRVYEFDDGELSLNASVKFEKPNSAVDIIPNAEYDKKKCEIARFISLSSEKTLELGSLCVPRAKSETVVQEDLYPIPKPLPLISGEEWFESNSKPLTLLGEEEEEELEALADLKSPVKLATSSSGKTITINRGQNPTVKRGNSLKKTKTLNTKIDRKRTSASIAENEAIDAMAGFLDQEIRGWFANDYVKRWVCLKSSRIFASIGEDLALAPIAKYENITKIQNMPPKDKDTDTGFEFDSVGVMYRWIAASTAERDQWVEQLKILVDQHSKVPETDPKTKKALPALQKDLHDVPLLLSNLKFLEKIDDQGNEVWSNRFVRLDPDGMIHFLDGNMKNYTQNAEPIESLDLSFVIAVRRAKDRKPPTMSINSVKRTYHLRGQKEIEIRDWIEQIEKLIPEGEGDGMVMDSIVTANYVGKKSNFASWMTYCDSKIYYFKDQFSLTPLFAVNVEDIGSFGLADDYSVVKEALSNESANDKITILFNKNEMIDHYFRTPEDFKYVLLSLEKVRRANWNLTSRLGLSTQEQVESALKQFNPDAGIDGVLVYNEKSVLNSSQKILVKCQDGNTNVVEATFTSLSSDASFVLDTGNIIYHWSGEYTSRICRAEGLNLASSIRKYRGSRPTLKIVEKDDKELLLQFFKALGAKNEIATADMKRGSGNYREDSVRIFGNTAANPYHVVFLFEGVKPSKTILKGGCILISKNQIYTWFEKGVDPEQRLFIRLCASMMAKDRGFVFLSDESQEMETPLFKWKFSDYPSDLPISMRVDEVKGIIAKDIVQEPIDIKGLISSLKSPQESIPSNDGSVQLFKIKSFNKIKLEHKLHGLFSQTESYVISYVYREGGQEKCNLYFWQGSKSTIIEKGTSAVISIEMSKDIGCEVSQIRVLEGKEPRPFYSIFKTATLIVLKETRVPEPTDYEPVVFDVRDYEGMPKAYEVSFQEVANGFHTLVILTGKESFVYSDGTALESELIGANSLVERFGVEKSPKKIDETKLVDIFSKNDIKWSPKTLTRQKTRLFSCSGASGMIKVEEIPRFTQEDLNNNTVMILDAVDSMYLWIGTQSKPNEQLMAIKTFQEYLNLSSRGNIRYTATYPFQESPEFSNKFHGWRKTKFPLDKSNLPVKERAVDEILSELEQREYSKQVLLSGKIPEHLDRTCLELYLSDFEFREIFKMEKAAYTLLQPWKREPLRKKAGFF